MFFLILFLLSTKIFSITLSCTNCDTTDCSSDCNSLTSGGLCNDPYGCYKIYDSENTLEECKVLSVDSSSSFSFASNKYFCTKYNQIEEAYVWKTCRTGEGSDVPWVSENLACNSEGELLNCGELSDTSISSTSATCDTPVKNFYCPEGADSWKTANEAKDECSGACNDIEKVWTGSKCCDGTDNYVEGVYLCASGTSTEGLSCGQTSGGYYFSGSTWTLSPSLDACSEICTAIKYDDGTSHKWDSSSKCCDGTDDFTFSTASLICVNGKDYSCSESTLCNVKNGKICIKSIINENTAYIWSENTCSSVGACIGYSWNSDGCSSLNGWYNYGNVDGLDDPIAEQRDYYCGTSVECTYTISNTKDCDTYDGWYGGGNTEGCGNDPSISLRDFYVNSEGSCSFLASGLDDSCDDGDGCEIQCLGSVVQKGDDYYWNLIEEGQDEKPPCVNSVSSEVDCNTKLSEEIGDYGLDYGTSGYVRDYEGCGGGVCLYTDDYDFCNQNILTEYYIETNSISVNSSSYDCTQDSEIREDASQTINKFYYWNCICSSGVCSCGTLDLDNLENECSGTNLFWINSKCCGDDSSEYKITSSIDATEACCITSSECVSGSTCYSTGDEVSNGRYICSEGTWVDAFLNDCTLTENQYSLDGAWVDATLAKDDCSNACISLSYDWDNGCCYSDKEGTLSSNLLCDGSKWLSCSINGEIVLNYLCSSSSWTACTFQNEGQELLGYVCLSSSWTNKDCEENADLSLTYCETNCQDYWVSDNLKCCGNSPNDEFFINEPSELCDGVDGKKICEDTTTCNKTTWINPEKTFYCLNNEWVENSLFEGKYISSYGTSKGCCQQYQCWDNGCFNNGKTKTNDTTMLCVSSSWEICDESKLCQSVETALGTRYCTDSGWSSNDETICQAGRGVCKEGSCNLCGTSFSIGETFDIYRCNSDGYFGEGCNNNSLNCIVEDECKKGLCLGSVCSSENKVCGTPCSTGFCNGNGVCVSSLEEGSLCSCTEVCQEGLYCDGSCKTLESCGDGICDEGECSACKQDCSSSDCFNDGSCTTYFGENCQTSPSDCDCGNKFCDVTSDLADSWGCVQQACGNGVCEKGECAYCLSDCSVEECAGNGVCDIILGETCDNSPDCNCNVIVTTETLPTLRIGETQKIKVYVENNGNAPMLVKLNLDADGLQVSGMEQSVYLASGETKEVQYEVTPQTTGIKQVNVLANSNQGQINAGTLSMTVKKLTAWESLTNKFKNSEFFKSGLYESLDTVLGIVGIITAVITFFKVFIPKNRKIRNPYTRQVPGYYYGNQYQPRTPQNYKRGYYRL